MPVRKGALHYNDTRELLFSCSSGFVRVCVGFRTWNRLWH